VRCGRGDRELVMEAGKVRSERQGACISTLQEPMWGQGMVGACGGRDAPHVTETARPTRFLREGGEVGWAVEP